MKKNLFWILWVIIVLAVSSCGPSGPQEFTSPEGRFSITAQKPFKASTQTITASGISLPTYMFIADMGTRTDMVAYTDYPEDVVSQSDPAKMLDGASNGAVQNVNGTLVSQDEITLDGNPGRDIVANAAAKNGQEVTMRARLYMVKNRLYMIIIVANKGQLTREQTDAFLDSFKLLQ